MNLHNATCAGTQTLKVPTRVALVFNKYFLFCGLHYFTKVQSLGEAMVLRGRGLKVEYTRLAQVTYVFLMGLYFIRI